MTQFLEINWLYNALSADKSPDREIEALVEHFQSEHFVILSIAQEQRKRGLKEYFSGNFSGKVFVSDWTLGQVKLEKAGLDIYPITSPEFLQLRDDGALDGAIVLSNSNDALLNDSLETYMNFYLQADKSIIAVWDFDNHHRSSTSTILAAYSDMYFPTHPDYFSLYSRYNRTIAGPISPGVIQWTQDYLREQIDLIANTLRFDEPLGMHYCYEPFKFRNQAVYTLSEKYPSIGFAPLEFAQLTALDRLQQWCAYKAHWLVPVLNDIPIRLFDALATGGVPIVPNTLKYHPEIDALQDHLVYYEATDLLEPGAVVAAANKKFDEGGIDMLMERHRLGVDEHHASVRVAKIIDIVMREFGIDAG